MKSLILILFVVVLIPQIQAQPQAWEWIETGHEVKSILLMGDNNIQLRDKPEEAFKFVIPTLDEATFRFLNLEGAFAGASKDPRVPDIPHKNWQHSEKDQVAALTAAGIDAVGVANNVTYPWQALMLSLEVLKEAGIPYAGGGEDMEAAHKPVILERDGLKVGFMQYAATVFPYNHAASETQPGIAEIKVYTAYKAPRNLDKPGQPPIVVTWLDEKSKERMIDDIRHLSAQADIVIVSFHWGVSNTTEIISYQSDIGKAVIDAGADVVFGHGPHKYQKIEIYQGKPIFYSLAQFVFDDRRADRVRRFREGLLLRLTVKDKKINGISLVPSWREDDNFVRLYDPNVGKGKELYQYLESVNEEGAGLRIVGKEIIVEGFHY